MCDKILDLLNIATEEMSYAYKLTIEAIESASFRSTNTKERTTELYNFVKDRELRSSCETINGLIDAILHV